MIVVPASIYSLTQLYRSNKICITANKTVVSDLTAALYNTVIVNGHCTAAEIDLFTHVAIAHISEVCNCSTFADRGILDLNKVADFNSALYMAARTDMNPRSDLNTGVNRGLERLNIV